MFGLISKDWKQKLVKSMFWKYEIGQKVKKTIVKTFSFVKPQPMTKYLKEFLQIII